MLRSIERSSVCSHLTVSPMTTPNLLTPVSQCLSISSLTQAFEGEDLYKGAAMVPAERCHFWKSKLNSHIIYNPEPYAGKIRRNEVVHVLTSAILYNCTIPIGCKSSKTPFIDIGHIQLAHISKPATEKPDMSHCWLSEYYTDSLLPHHREDPEQLIIRRAIQRMYSAQGTPLDPTHNVLGRLTLVWRRLLSRTQARAWLCTYCVRQAKPRRIN